MNEIVVRLRCRHSRCASYSFCQRADKIKHGTPNGYANYGCACELCTKAWADYQANYRRLRKEGGDVLINGRWRDSRRRNAT